MYGRYVALREKKGVTDYRVAVETGITKSTFSDWKSGRSVPKADKLLSLAKYFDVPVEFVLVLAIAVLCAGCTYNFDIASSVETKSFNSTSYFSTIDIFSIFELFFSFNPLTTFSASSKLETYAFSS